MKYAGIDVSKRTLQTALADLDSFVTDNTPKGRASLIAILRKRGIQRVVVEATGPYSLGIASDIAAMEGCAVMVANPRHTRSFAKSLGQRGKSDVADAKMLLRYASSVEFREWQPPSENLRELRTLMRRRDDLVALRASEKKRLAAEKALPSPCALSIDSSKRLLEHLAEEIARFEKAACAKAKADPKLAQYLNVFTTVPGIGAVTALAVLSEAGHLLGDVTPKQLVAYAGLDPRPWQSGTMNGRRRISRQGNKRLRCAMYLAAWNCTKYSPHVRMWRQQLIDRGKAPKVADVAVARRLIHALVGMLNSNAAWQGELFHPQENLLAAA